MKKIFAKLKNPKVIRTLLTVLVVIISVGGYFIYQTKQGRVFVDDSIVQAPLIAVSPDTPGLLQKTDVYEGENVQKGDELAVVAGQPLFADTDGVVAMANQQIGSTVSVANPVAQLIHLPDMRIAATIDENKGLSDIKVGQVASFTIDALPGKTFWGYVDEISPTAKQTQLSFSISSERPTQQFVVYARFDSSKYPEIKNGMSAKLTVYTNTN